MQITVQSNDGQATPVWITWLSKSDCAEHNQSKGLRPEMDDTLYIPGFYWCVCSPGCIPDSDFYGPFSTETAAAAAAAATVAVAAANEQLNW